MGYFVLDGDRCARISSAARGLWGEFLDLYPQFASHSLLKDSGNDQSIDQDRASFLQPSFPRNECVAAFCRHCSETMVSLPCLVTNWLSLEHWVPQVKGRPISWLHELKEGTIDVEADEGQIHAEFDHHAMVIMDLDYISSQDPRNLDRVWTSLLLHETGHLVLHWDTFAAQCAGGGKAMATDEQEAEAWYFQAVIFGMALGSYAHSCVRMPRGAEGDVHENAWLYVT